LPATARTLPPTPLRFFTASGSRLYFVADVHTGTGHELWTSDGTEKGTHIVADLLAGNDTIEALGPTQLGAAPDERVVFSVPTVDAGYELWISDGTPEGTRRVSDINAGANSSWPERTFLFNRTVLFSAYEPSNHRELWAYRLAGGSCPCDWDNTGVVDSRDFFEFLNDFFNLAADFDGSGATNSSDFFSFLACFFENDCK
jgi:ELWxxDGT repeat protein